MYIILKKGGHVLLPCIQLWVGWTDSSMGRQVPNSERWKGHKHQPAAQSVFYLSLSPSSTIVQPGPGIL